MRGGDVEYKCFVVVKTYDEHRILVIKVVRTAKTFLPTRSPGSPFGRTATLLRFRKTCTDHNVNGPVLVSVLWIQLRCSPSEEGGSIRRMSYFADRLEKASRNTMNVVWATPFPAPKIRLTESHPMRSINPHLLARSAALLLSGVFTLLPTNLLALGGPDYVLRERATGSFPLFDRTAAQLIVASNDWPGVHRVARDLAKDIYRVTGTQPDLHHRLPTNQKYVVLIGTIGRSAIIDRLVLEEKIDVTAIAGKWESFFLQVVSQPLPGIESALVICGSDKRGTIYGCYDLSEQIGVSPWHYWADSPAKKHDRLFIRAGKFVTGPPSVKYRGIFINDEAPALTGWVTKQFGQVEGLPGVANYGRGFYTNIFEVLLRLRANYLWPAMWNNAFNEDDPENPRLADEYGIVMGTSHQEPMLRAQKEWDRRLGRQHGNWDYNKSGQRPILHQFWREGVRRNKVYESIITMGLRAANDSAEPVGKEVTEEIVAVQRRILAEEINPDLTKVPQMWCLYKEVMDYYRDGMRVPDDVTLLWAEDNWGNIRRLPTAAERQRSGGAGIYYHFDYHGGPRSYQWINTSPITKIWDQMSLAKQYGADRIWIVNVGHFNKSGEFPMEFFLRLAWDTDRWTNENLDEFTQLWAAREFGSTHATEIAELITTATKFNGRRKPELLDATTYSLLNYREFETVVADYAALAERAQRVYDRLPEAYRDAFYGMVQYPIKAAAGLNAMYLAAAKNALYAQQGRTSANDFAAQTRALFDEQIKLAAHFNHDFAGGKWNGFMDQPYIGYRSWNPPRTNNLDAVALTEISVPETALLGVAVEGDTAITGGTLYFDKFGQPTRYIEIFNRGRAPFQFAAKPSVPWLILNESGGTVTKDQRLELSVNWTQAPTGTASAQINITGANTNFIVHVTTFNPAAPNLASFQGFIEGDGFVSMGAEQFTKHIAAGANRWIQIPDYGHTLSGMRADGPPEVLAMPGQNSPCLEYEMYLFHSGSVKVETFVGSTLNFMPGRPLRYAISFDDETPQTVTVVPADFDARNGNRDWEESVKNNYRRIISKHTITKPGVHTLKIWMVDPAVVLQKIVVNTGGVKPGYLGPPPSRRQGDSFSFNQPKNRDTAQQTAKNP